ncbi:hypothetical protein CsSME_00000380 [Camellia sinensis var. sinensis]
MLLRNTFHKTKMFFHKTLQNLKSFLFGRYKKLPKTRPINPLYGSNGNPKWQQLDQFNRNFYEQWQSDNDKVIKSKELMNEVDTTNGSFTKFEDRNALKSECKVREKEEKKIGSISQGRGGEACSQTGNGGEESYMLAEKMRELEMMAMNDVDHVLDIEEVLHNYLRLMCPVYLAIVDNFFVDMYSEFLILKPSMTITNSLQRLGPLKF